MDCGLSALTWFGFEGLGFKIEGAGFGVYRALDLKCTYNFGVWTA